MPAKKNEEVIDLKQGENKVYKEEAEKQEAIEPGLPAKREEDQLVPNINDIIMLSEGLFKSNLFPNIKNKYGALAIIEYGRELGLKPVMSLQLISFVNGKLCMEAKAMQALAEKRGVRVKIIEKNREKSVVEFSRPGKDPYIETFTIDDARKIGLLAKNNWKFYPEEMCYYRCMAKGLRVYDPGSLLGLYLEDEAEDIQKSIVESEKEEKKEEEKVKTISVDEEVKKKSKAGRKKKTSEVEPQKVVTIKEESEYDQTPPGDPAKQTVEEKLEYYREFILDYLALRYRPENKEKEYIMFKRFLGEFLGEGKDRTYVGKNEWGHWSIRAGKLEDVAIVADNMELAISKYEEWKKNLPDPDKVPF